MRDKQKQNEWRKEHYRNVVGLRPTKNLLVESDNGYHYGVTPNDFLFRKRGEKTYQVFGRQNIGRVHFTRSLGRRVRITLDEKDKVVGETDRCFK